MEVSYVDINECCRCCMNFSDDLDNIFECFYKNLELQEVLSLVSGLPIAMDDGFPCWICDTCKDNTMRAFDFRETCQQSSTEIQAIKAEMRTVEEEEDSEFITEEIEHEELPKDIFVCATCQSVFSSSSQLAQHITKAHENRKFECHICTKRFESQYKVNRHLTVHKDVLNLPPAPVKDKILKYECQECGKLFETPSKLARHALVHDKRSKFTHGVNQHRPLGCPECPLRFWDEIKLERHKFTHTADFRASKIESDTFTCVICLTRCESFEAMLEHMRAHTEDPPITCRLCSRAYPKLANVIRHAKLHAENATHQCTHCGRKFGYGDDFIDHVLRHRQFRPHVCDYAGCGKSFMKIHKLRLHWATHESRGEKLFQCDICEKKFAELEYLRKHIVRHTGVKNFGCRLCPARFATQSGLNSHASTHTNERNFECEICSAKFAKQQSLQLHVKTHTNEKRFKCDYCEMRFIASGQLRRHTRTHTLEKPYKCDYCQKAYAQSNDLMKHLKTHLGPNIYNCSMCTQSFEKFKELKEHKMEHYRNDTSLVGHANSIEAEEVVIESEFL